jgi:hypothetical protein
MVLRQEEQHASYLVDEKLLFIAHYTASYLKKQALFIKNPAKKWKRYSKMGLTNIFENAILYNV